VPLCLTVIDKELKSSDYKVTNDNTVHLYSYTDNIRAVSTALMNNNIMVTELSVLEQSLEEYFLSITGGVHND
jgi:ABC-2 type transport system ATP-binding protein